jgi:hypothetical protein
MMDFSEVCKDHSGNCERLAHLEHGQQILFSKIDSINTLLNKVFITALCLLGGVIAEIVLRVAHQLAPLTH